MTLRKLLMIGVLLALVASPVVAIAGPSETNEATRRFEAMLLAIDVVPDRAALERAWPDARARLLAAARDDARDLYTRSRALSLLSYFPEPSVRAALETLAAHPEVEVRRLAVYTLARTFGVPGDRALVALLEDATADVSPRVRQYAIRGLRWVDHPDAERALARIAETQRGREAGALAGRTLERRARRLSRPGR